MASASLSHTFTDEERNLVRLGRLLVSVGTQALRDTFDKIHPPACLHRDLRHLPGHPTLQSLRKKRVLTAAQWEKLYPTIPTSVSSANFDLTLLIVLLKNICGLTPPASTGSWDILPPSSDTSLEANISRVNYYRNTIYAHVGQASVNDSTFIIYWEDISNALLGLGAGVRYGAAIDMLKTGWMDPDIKEQFQELLKEWKKDDDNTKRKLAKIEEMLQQWKTGEGSIEDKLGELEEMLSQWKKEEANTKDKLEQLEGSPLGIMMACDPKTLEFGEGSSDNYYGRLSHLLLVCGREVLIDVFDAIHPPASLFKVLSSHQVSVKLRTLYRQGILNYEQWDKLYPVDPSKVSSANFDLMLLLLLLRNICDLNLPTSGWDGCPPAGDGSVAADIGRVNYFLSHLSHFKPTSLDYTTYNKYWKDINDVLMRLGYERYSNDIENLKISDDPQVEEYYQGLMEQWATDEDYIKTKLEEIDEETGDFVKDIPVEDTLELSWIIDRIKENYNSQSRPISVSPLSEALKVDVDDVHCRIRVVTKKPTRSTSSYEDINISDIFKPRVECRNPQRVLVVGRPGIGKSMLCRTIVHDWVRGNGFEKFEVVLLVTCRNIKAGLWETIDDQLLPCCADKEKREQFFRYIRNNQSKVLLVLDGLDEFSFSNTSALSAILQRKELPDCFLMTTRREAGRRLPKFCDTLLEIEGFTVEEAKKLFNCSEQFLQNLVDNFSYKLRDSNTRGELMVNPLDTALACHLHQTVPCFFPESRTVLFGETVRNFLSFGVDLHRVGALAYSALLENRSYFEENELAEQVGSISSLGSFVWCLPDKTRYSFLHLSFQEYLAALYLSHQLLEGEIDPQDLLAENRYFNELDQVLSFLMGLIAAKEEEQAKRLVKILARKVSQLSADEPSVCGSNLSVALRCIRECGHGQKSHRLKLARVFGEELTTEEVALKGRIVCESSFGEDPTSVGDGNDADLLAFPDALKFSSDVSMLAEVLAVNTSLTKCNLSGNNFSDLDTGSLAEALNKNRTLKTLDLSLNSITEFGVCLLADALASNSSLTGLDLSANNIGNPRNVDSVAANEEQNSPPGLTSPMMGLYNHGVRAIGEVLKVNISLIRLSLAQNYIGDQGATSLADGLETNTTLESLDLSANTFGELGAHFLAKALKMNCSLTTLILSDNNVGDGGAVALAMALEVNCTLSNLGLSKSSIGVDGIKSLSEALKVNTSLTRLGLSGNNVGDGGAVALAMALKVNRTLLNLGLSKSSIGADGIKSLAEALKVNTSLTRLVLSDNNIDDQGAIALAEALKENSTLTHLGMGHGGDA